MFVVNTIFYMQETPAGSAGWQDPHGFYTCLHLASLLLIFSPFREDKIQLPSPTSPLNYLQFIKYQTRLCGRLKCTACPEYKSQGCVAFLSPGFDTSLETLTPTPVWAHTYKNTSFKSSCGSVGIQEETWSCWGNGLLNNLSATKVLNVGTSFCAFINRTPHSNTLVVDGGLGAVKIEENRKSQLTCYLH